MRAGNNGTCLEKQLRRTVVHLEEAEGNILTLRPFFRSFLEFCMGFSQMLNLTNCNCWSFIWLASCGLSNKSHRLASKLLTFCDMKMFNSPRPLPFVAINLYQHLFFNSFWFALHKSYNLCFLWGKCWCRSKLWGCFSPWLQTLGK